MSNLVGSEAGKLYAGSSALIGPEGDVRACASPFDEQVLLATADLRDIARVRAGAPLLADLRAHLPHVTRALDGIPGSRQAPADAGREQSVGAASREPGAETKIVPVQEIPNGWYGLDIGPASVKLFSEAVQNAKTILWNGPMGMFEVDAFARGTLAMAHSVANAYALTIVGGGETALAIHRAGESESISFISTGGGAALELLEGKTLPGLAALPNREPH